MSGRSTRRRQAGLTLVELLVAMTLSTILIGVGLQIGVIVINGYRQHREAVAVQRAARGALDLVSDAIRNAMAAVPTGKLYDAAACSDVTGIKVVDHTGSPDELQLITASGGVVTSTRIAFAQTTSTLVVVDGSGFVAGDLLLVSDFDTGYVVRVSSAPTDNGDGTWTIDLDPITCAGTIFTISRGAAVLRAKVERYYVDTVDGVPTLFLDDDSDGPDTAEPLAEGIEDFQIAVGVDVNGDGTVTDSASTSDEWFYNVLGDAAPPAVTVTAWRALRVTVIARTTTADTVDWSTRPGAEDHAGATGPDGYRRRTVSSTVEIRNLSGSP